MKRAHCRKKLAGTLGMLSKVMRIPRQQEVTALRTYLQIRIGLHAAFNACEEMCQRVALERQLDSEERALLIERSQTVIRQGRDILHAWDATRNSAQALDNALQPDRAAQFADATGEIRCRSGNRTQPFSSNNA